MGRGKLILICQSGGEFVTNDDGTLSYAGGEANAVNISNETVFDDLKLKLAEMCDLDHKTMSIKYFLPGNNRNLITLRSKNDFKRMIDFHGNSVTADVFVSGTKGFDRNALNRNIGRDRGIKLAETVNYIPASPVNAAATVKAANPAITTAPARRAVSGRKAKRTPLSANADSLIAVDAAALSSSPTTTSSASSSDNDADYDSDYAPRSIRPKETGADDPAENGTNSTPAETVKKRRRTASWKIGKNGPTVVSIRDKAGGRRKSGKKNCRSLCTVVVADDMEQEQDAIAGEIYVHSLSANDIFDDDSLEKQVASWRYGITGVGQEFPTVKEFRDALQKYAIAHRFVYKLKKNDTNRVSGICVVEGCSWQIHALWVQDSQSFIIKKFYDTHTCGGESWKSAYPAKNWLVNIIKDRLRDSPHQKPKEIAKSISRDFGIDLNYAQVWRGVEHAREQLHGSHKEAYDQLLWFCERILEENPGSHANLVFDDEKRFQRFFVSFHASVHGFQNGCRPLLFIDAISLKSKYHESLLTATAVDGNDSFLPVAFAVVDVEDDDSWRWFLEQLKSALQASEAITFVSDKEMGLKKIVLEIFENAHHGYSMYHLLDSFKKHMKGPFQGDGKATLPGNFVAAAHAVRLTGFSNFIEKIKQVSPPAYEWVMQVEQEDWTSLFSKGERHNYIIEDFMELYSKVVEDVRESTIVQKVESLGYMISQLINDRQMESSKWSTKLTPVKEERIMQEAREARSLKVLVSTDTIFEVHDDCNHVVNISNLDCTCLMWKVTGLPCSHAIAVFMYTGRNVYDYCSKYFTAHSYCLTYSESVNPVSGVYKPAEGEDAEADNVHVFPPCTTRASDQPKRERIKIEDPNKRTVCCSRCKEPGHNKASCKAIL